MLDSPNPIILYDGVCALCNRLNQFVLKRDSQDQFRFASLQSAFATELLRKHGISPQLLDTVYIVQNHAQAGEQLVARSAAVLTVLRGLGGIWSVLAVMLGILPRWLRDWGYNQIASRRYRVFGKCESCPLPKEKDRGKFLDL